MEHSEELTFFEGKIILAYSDKIEQSEFEHFVTTLEQMHEKNPFPRFENLLTILGELTQNIIKYGMQMPHDKNLTSIYEALIMINYDTRKDKYFVTTGNIISQEKLRAVKESIHEANSLSKEEIRQLYRERRRTGEKAHNRGAGIGFLELAKRSSEKMEYKLHKMSDEYSYFLIRVYN